MVRNILFFLLISILISLIICKSPYVIENDVIFLNEHSYETAIHEFKYLLILFYDPGFPQTSKFLIEYEKLASNLKKENFVLFKIDSTKSSKISNHFKIKELPTIILLKNGQKFVYENEKNANEIEKWLKEKTKPIFKKIYSKTELEKIKKNNKASIVYFGKNEKTIEELILADRKIGNFQIYTVDSDQLIKENGKTNEYIMIFKPYDEKKSTLKDKLNSKNIIKFVYTYGYKKVLEFSEENASLILYKRNPALVMFSTKSERHYDDSLNLFNYMWKRIKNKIRMYVWDIKEDKTVKLAEMCGVTQKDIPKVFIVQRKGETLSRYEFSGGINEENLDVFMGKWAKGKLNPYLRSEKEPKKNDGDIFILVGKNFKKEVIKNDKDVLIFFVSPDCKVCKEFEPKLAEFAKNMKKYNPKLLIAKMDATLNDIEDYIIYDYPSIRFYKGNAKNEEPLSFNDFNINNLYDFIKNNAYNKIISENDVLSNADL